MRPALYPIQTHLPLG